MRRPDRCIHNHPDCFALSFNQTCLALRDTDFPADCPFYKSRKQMEQEDERRKKRVRLQR